MSREEQAEDDIKRFGYPLDSEIRREWGFDKEDNLEDFCDED